MAPVLAADARYMVQDEYFALSYKTMALWRLVEDNFEVDYLIKADDDNFVRLDRLSVALTQWDEEDAGESALPLLSAPRVASLGNLAMGILRCGLISSSAGKIGQMRPSSAQACAVRGSDPGERKLGGRCLL